MAPTYKLIYFDVYGVAEPIRFIFAYLNLEYEDKRITAAEWQSIKSTTPFGKIPVLEIDGKPVAQSAAIARYLANQYGLTGKDAWDSLQCDVLIDTLNDLLQGVNLYTVKQKQPKISRICVGFMNMLNESDSQRREEIRKNLMKKDIPFYLGKFNNLVSDNSEGYLVGSQVTWTDLFFASTLGMLEQIKPGFLTPYPALSTHVEKICNIPGVKAWIEKRPTNTTQMKF